MKRWQLKLKKQGVTVTYTVKSAYKEPAYKDLPVIRIWFLFPNLKQETSSPYVYKELRL